MTRRVVKTACELEASREVRPGVNRRFGAGSVLNVLQWENPAVARFTVEGEGCEVWCSPQTAFEAHTESPEPSIRS
jgi:hypothetical protein